MSEVRHISRRQYLTVVAIAAGSEWPAAIEAVSSVAIEHPEWDMEERRTWDEWSSSPPDEAMYEVLPTFICPRCGMQSAHYEDIRYGYCGNCNEFTGRGSP